MGTIDKVLFVRPKWDDNYISPGARFPYLMYYMHWRHEVIVGFATSLGLDVVDLEIENATRANFEAQLSSQDPALVIHGSHGGNNLITGQDGTVLMCSPVEECAAPASPCPTPNHGLLAGRVMVTHSCLSATCLGPSAVGAGANAYLGSEPLLWDILGGHPAYYNCEESLKSCWSASPTELLTGQNSLAAHAEEIGRYDYWANWYTEDGNPRSGYPEAEDIVDILNRGRSGWVHLGSPTTTTTKSRPAAGRVRCTSWGGSPVSPSELNIDVTIAGDTHTTPFDIELSSGDYSLSFAGKSDTIRIWGGETTDLNLKLFTVGRLECTALYDSTEVGAEVVITDVGTYLTPFGIDLAAGDYHLVGYYEDQVEERDFTIEEGITTSIVLRFGRPAGPSAEVRNLAYPAQVVPGEPIPLSFDLMNRGGVKGAMYAKIDGTELFRGDIPADGSQPVSSQIPEMPPYDLGLTIEAGHSSELWEKRVIAGPDDTTAVDNINFHTWHSLQLRFRTWPGDRHHSGYRFTDVPIPQGAQILSAELALTTNRYQGNIHTMLYGEATGNATDFAVGSYLLDRPQTAMSVGWFNPLPRVVGWVGTSPDISSIIQEIVDRPDWSPGNAIVIIHLTTGKGDFEQWSWAYDGSPSRAPKLKIEYLPV